jgi:probable F420-dependent oxidoreductase
MRFAISMPQVFDDGTFDPASFGSFLTRAEELGFESAWTQEQVLGSIPQFSPLETMAYAAAMTDTIRLGCAVFVTPLHTPVELAKSIASLDQLSRGRVEVGVGAGGGFRPFAAFGITGEAFVARFNEGLRLMRACWTEERITFDGRFWQVQDAAMEPKPFQKPHPPIWFGGGHPDALRRAVRSGDGFFGAGSTTTANFREQVKVVRSALPEEQRDSTNFQIAKRIYYVVDDDPERARQRAHDRLAAIYASVIDVDLTPVAVFGSAQACIGGVQEVVDAGAELVLLTPLGDEREQMERAAAEVMPAFS